MWIPHESPPALACGNNETVFRNGTFDALHLQPGTNAVHIEGGSSNLPRGSATALPGLDS